MNCDINLVLWNVCGLCEPDRKYVVKNWIKDLRPRVDILALQEVKADQFRLDLALRAILPGFQHFTAPPDAGRGGTALLISPSLKVIASGNLDLGRAVWVQIVSGDSNFGIICLYAPNSPNERALLWHEIKCLLPQDNWICCGDSNMTESRLDSSGPSPLIRGREAEFWRLLKLRFDLSDAFHILEGKIIGSRFTWRRTRNGALVESRLDRFYFSDKGWWVGRIERLTHEGGSAFSDHDPITLRITLDSSSPTSRGKSVFLRLILSFLERKKICFS